MNLENISCDPKTVLKGAIIPHLCVKFLDFCNISKTIQDIKKCFIQKFYNKIIFSTSST